MRVLLSTAVVAVTLCLAPLSGIAHASMPASGEAQLTTKFTVGTTTQIPGAALKAGAYTLVVLDHLADRTVLRVDNEKGKTESTFLGLPSGQLGGSNASGPILWGKGPHKSEAMRGFAFAGNTAVEFVYPKDEAVAIAKVNTDKVLAIDPASEGRPAISKLSDEDRKMVTLWTLASTRVGPPNNTQPAIEAERYQPASVGSPSASQTVVASSDAGSISSSPRKQTASIQQRRPAPNQQVASLRRPAGLSALPHTASSLPLVWLLGFSAILCVAGLRIVRGVLS